MPTRDARREPCFRADGAGGPKPLLVLLAGAVFLGCLGSVELWGKREQRAAAEAIDTVDHDHWLVAQIQGRPRLEKPPLPRWSIAALMLLTGRRDLWMIRLPGALAGVATVAIVFAWAGAWGAARWGWPRRSSSARSVSSWVKCARRAMTVSSCCSRPWPSLPRIAVSDERSTRQPARMAMEPRLLHRTGTRLLDQGARHLVARGRDDRPLPGVLEAIAVGPAQVMRRPGGC